MPDTRKTSKSKSMSEDPVIAKLDCIQSDISQMKGTMEMLTAQVYKLQSDVDAIKDLKDSVEFTQEKVSNLEANVAGIEAETKQQNARCDLLERKLSNSEKQNAFLKELILAQDSYSRRENLKIVNIPESSNETKQVLLEKVRNIFSSDLGITDVENIKFQRYHRVGRKFDNQSRDVIIRFAYFPDRENVWSCRSKLEGTNYILKEDFPDEIESRRSKLYKTYKLAREKKYKVKMIADMLIINGKKYTWDALEKLPPDLHPKNHSEKHTDGSVLFYGGYSPLSNFHPCCFTLNGNQYNSVEQYFQYRKAIAAGNKDVACDIMAESDPKQQYYLGKNLKPDESQWNDQISKQTMKKGVNAKFAQCSTLKNDLLGTKDKLIIQCNPYDTVWSNGLKMNDENVEDPTKWKGQNLLGKIICEVREALK